LKPEVLKGATMAVDVDAASLTPQEREVLKQFTRGGGTYSPLRRAGMKARRGKKIRLRSMRKN